MVKSKSTNRQTTVVKLIHRKVRLSNMNRWTHVLRQGKQFLFHQCHQIKDMNVNNMRHHTDVLIIMSQESSLHHSGYWFHNFEINLIFYTLKTVDCWIISCIAYFKSFQWKPTCADFILLFVYFSLAVGYLHINSCGVLGSHTIGLTQWYVCACSYVGHIFPSICIVTSVNRNLGFVQGVDRYFHDYLNLTESISTAICWWWTGFVFEVKDTTDTTGFAWYTDLHIDIDSDSRLRTTPYTEYQRTNKTMTKKRGEIAGDVFTKTKSRIELAYIFHFYVFNVYSTWRKQITHVQIDCSIV